MLQHSKFLSCHQRKKTQEDSNFKNRSLIKKNLLSQKALIINRKLFQNDLVQFQK